MEPDEIVLVNGRIYATAASAPAQAILLRAGRVVRVGESEAVRAGASPSAREIDLGGATVTAGFTDAHVHLTAWAFNRLAVPLAESNSIAEAVAHAGNARPTAGWVRGHGWSRERLGRLPTAEDLDSRFPDVPVWFDSQDLHSAWLNSTALRACGIDEGTLDPAGGRIVRDPASGRPTGVLLENARATALEKLPVASTEEVVAALREAVTEANALGLTGVHSVERTGLRDFQMVFSRDDPTLRVLQHIQLDQLREAVSVGVRSGFGGEWLRVGGVKMFLDGSLGSQTAWMREPYRGGGPQDRGVQVLSGAEFRDAVGYAAENGLASTVHAIGDAAVALAIDVLRETAPPAALPHRVEHLQLCPPDLRSRLGGTEIVASVQPTHLLTDRAPAERHWGADRSRSAYPFASILEGGTVLAFGSDVPVETLDPRAALYAATARGSWAGFRESHTADDVWTSEERLGNAAAVAAYTEGPAYAAGLSLVSGRLLPGYWADLVAWDVDPLLAGPDDFRRMQCLLTIVGGRIVHRKTGW